MIADDLKRLLALSANLEKPKVERAARADTKKNRLALVDACQTQSIDALRRLIDIGAPINFVNDRSGGHADRTVLAICARSGWIEGLQALLDAGADENLIPNYLQPVQLPAKAVPGKRQPPPPPATCLGVAARACQAEAFTALLPSHDAERQQEALRGTSDAGIFLAAKSAGIAHMIDKERQISILMDSLAGIDPASQTAGSFQAKAFDELSASVGAAKDPALLSALWTRALSQQRPGVLQGLAQRGLLPGADGTMEFVPARDFNRRIDYAMPGWTRTVAEPTPWNKDNTKTEWLPAGAIPVRLGLASAAAALHSYGPPLNLHALCAVAALRDELFASPIGLNYLALLTDAALFKRLGEQGCDLSLARDSRGRNPLHAACRAHEPKTHLEALARLCTEWISHRDSEGKMPLELAGADRQASLSPVFDQIGMRDAMKGRLGSRHVPAKTRRL